LTGPAAGSAGSGTTLMRSNTRLIFMPAISLSPDHFISYSS
jgi:hypothetical protein